jgi:hypothetical protein
MKLKIVPILAAIVIVFSGCNFIQNASDYKRTSLEFTSALVNKDINKCVDLMALDHELAKGMNIDTLKMGLRYLSAALENNFGGNLSWYVINVEKTFSTIEAEKMPPNTTYVVVEIDNNENVGALRYLFDDVSKKVLNVKLLDIKEPVPNMTIYWLFGVLALIVVGINIYAIVLIKQSNRKKKWLKYISVILLNVPTITYGAIAGLGYKLLHFQFLLGVGFHAGGYLSSAWDIGIPIAGIYWIISLKFRPQKPDEPTLQSEIPLDDSVPPVGDAPAA